MWKKLKNPGGRQAPTDESGVQADSYGGLPYDGSQGLGISVKRNSPPARPTRDEHLREGFLDFPG